jgi:hypothetical protein
MFPGNQGGLDIRTASNYIVLSDGDGNPRQVIDSSGNVGIGTSSPSAKLDVVGLGQFKVSSAGTSIPLRLVNDDTSSTTVVKAAFQNGGVIKASINVAVYNNDFMTFNVGSDTERMRIDSSGNLLVGTTVNTATNTKLSVSYDGNSVNGCGFIDSTGTTAGTRYSMFFQRGTGTIVGSISTTTSTTSFNTSSDYRLKENIAPMTGALDVVSQLKPVTYTWKTDGSDGQGFIAHELAEVVPDCVTGEKDAVDAEGNPKYQGIDTSFLVATLTAAIQELKAEFDAYKATHP